MATEETNTSRKLEQAPQDMLLGPKMETVALVNKSKMEVANILYAQNNHYHKAQSPIQDYIEKSQHIQREFPKMKQPTIMSCGAATISQILSFLHKHDNVTLEKLVKETEPRFLKNDIGISPGGLVKLLNKHLNNSGYKARLAYKPSLDEIIEKVDAGLPVSCMMLVQVNKHRVNEGKGVSPDHYGYHYQSVIGYSRTKDKKDDGEDNKVGSGKVNYIRLSNPMGYEEVVSVEEFMRRRALADDLFFKTQDKLLKQFGITKSQTTLFIEPTEEK